MKLKFTCRKCKITGFASLSKQSPFVHCHWYMDNKGLVHNCIYCRSCGALHDTVGPFFIPVGLIRLLFRRVPSKVTATFEISEAKRLARINNPGFPSLRGIHPYILEALIEDGRLSEDEPFDEPDLGFLRACLDDTNFMVRREAIIAFRRINNEQTKNILLEMMKREDNWRVRKEIVLTLGEIGDIEIFGYLNRMLQSGKWKDHLIRKEIVMALAKLKRKIG